MKNCTVSNIENAKNIGPIELLISYTKKRDLNGKFTGEYIKRYELFEVVYTDERIVFGGSCNCGFIESGYIEREDGESLDETLYAMNADLINYYRKGPDSVTRIVCNDRM